MSALEFLGSLVSSLAWPVLVLVLVLFLKTPLTNLLSAERDGRRIASFKAGPSGLEIQYALDRAEADLERSQAEHPTLPSGGGTTSQLPADPGKRDPLYRISPAAAVLESYARLEQALRHAVEQHPDYVANTKVNTSMRGLARRADHMGIITEAERGAIGDLTSIRNFTAHGDADSVTEEAAERFTEIAGELIESIRARSGLPGRPADR